MKMSKSRAAEIVGIAVAHELQDGAFERDVAGRAWARLSSSAPHGTDLRSALDIVDSASIRTHNQLMRHAEETHSLLTSRSQHFRQGAG